MTCLPLSPSDPCLHGWVSAGAIGGSVPVVYSQPPLPLISVQLLSRTGILNFIPAPRYNGDAIFSCKCISSLSMILSDMNRLVLDGTSIPSGSKIKMLGDKNYILKTWIKFVVSATKVPVDDDYFYFSPLPQNKCERQEMRKSCSSLWKERGCKVFFF